MKNYTKINKTRLQNAIFNDKTNFGQGANTVVKEELLFVLSNYFDVKKNSAMLDITIDENGEIDIRLFAKANSSKLAKLHAVNIYADD